MINSLDYSLPKLHPRCFTVWHRNFSVWKKLFGPSLLMNFGEPLLYLLGLGLGLGMFVGDIQGLPYLVFLASGIVASSAMNTASFEALYSVFTRMIPQRTYEAMLATPLTVDDIVAGEMLWCATKSLVSGTAILIVAGFLGVVNSLSVLLIIPVLFLIGLCFAGLALVMTSFSRSYDYFNYYFTLFITPMFIFCGVFYPIETLPDFLEPIAKVLPLSHAIALTRPLIAGLPVESAFVHILALSAYALIGYYIAVVFIRKRLII